MSFVSLSFLVGAVLGDNPKVMIMKKSGIGNLQSWFIIIIKKYKLSLAGRTNDQCRNEQIL